MPLIAGKIKNYLGNKIDQDKIAVVSPDQGGIERARQFGEYFFGNSNFSLGVIEKKRSLEKIHQSKTLDLYGDVKDKIVILVDDMVVSGSTLVPATEICLKRGAKKIIAAVVHHDFFSNCPHNYSKYQTRKIFYFKYNCFKEGAKISKTG